ncbi:protein CASC3 isoform X2 [Dunckerocampus dactyliophorus]|uniref:protein CASC3 isoform X2 n=1 Tax=Dunckerocampus dactyliophorus TaxID=161453 RepID=UPI0024066389|nr:protein CASC3 isoform X2 [Dunckerocampus dactyliophorus]
MADRRRRRRRASQDSEDDDESGSGSDSQGSGSQTTKSRGREPEPTETVSNRIEAKNEVESECESEDGAGEAVLSDYDSADPEEIASHSEGAEEEDDADRYSDQDSPAAASDSKLPAATKPAVGEDDGEEQSKEENTADEKGNSAGERQSGDGQESTVDPETKAGGKSGQQLDDDEDRKNPAYIPRKGLFFEHDVRGHTQEEESVLSCARPKGRNRKLWKDEGRWEHDKFREEEQAPKSREELIAIYGYDIRNGCSAGERAFRQRRPRSSVSPNRDKRWREGGERAVRSWQSSRGGGPARGGPPSTSSLRLPSGQRSSNVSRSRLPHQSLTHHVSHPQCAGSEINAPQNHPRERAVPKPPSELAAEKGVPCKGGRGGGRSAASIVVGDLPVSKGVVEENPTLSTVTFSSSQSSGYMTTLPRRQSLEQREGDDSSAFGSSSADNSQTSAAPREASSPTERPVERKSYSLARRTRSRPAELGSKQPSMEEVAATGGGRVMGKSQVGAGGMAELDQDVARLSLVSGHNWNHNPTTYVRSEMRGLTSSMHVPGGPHQFSRLDEIAVSSNRAKRYSSQRQRGVAEPAPMHVGVMEGHYYEPMSYQGPIYTHGDGSTPIPPQGMLVQPEMHIPHPGLHPHQSGGPITNPTLYGGPPVSLSPGQPQQLLPPPFYPPPGVMTFPYPAMYPNPQGQSQVTYGGVTYYDTVQQQAQPKPSPPRRTSQPVTVKPPPPEVPFASE